jgi:signal peptidase I
VSIDRWAYRTKLPERGDVVTFEFPKDPRKIFLKRIIGIPGDTVSARGHALYINGVSVPTQPCDRERCSALFSLAENLESGDTIVEETLGSRSFFTLLAARAGPEDFDITIPARRYFVMGDNRDRSNDSRYWGFLPTSLIEGRVTYVYFSWDTVNSKVRWSRIGLQIH